MMIRHIVLMICAGLWALAVPTAVLAEDAAPPILTSIAGDAVVQSPQLQVGIVGDVMAQGLAQAFTRQLELDNKLNVELNNFAKGSSGFVRDDYYDWNEVLPPLLAANKLDYILVFMGSNDRQSIRIKGESYKKKTPKWREEYIHRIDKFLNSINDAGVKTIWLGQPISRGKSFSNDMALFNEIYRQHVESHDGVFFDVWNLFANEEGKYSGRGPDISGQIKTLRASNGIHFTRRGYDKLAFQILNLIEAAESDEEGAGETNDEGELVEAERYDLSRDEGVDTIIVERVEEDAPAENKNENAGNQVFQQAPQSRETAEKVMADAALAPKNEIIPLWKSVLENGEVLAPEFDRSDDFSWPRN